MQEVLLRPKCSFNADIRGVRKDWADASEGSRYLPPARPAPPPPPPRPCPPQAASEKFVSSVEINDAAATHGLLPIMALAGCVGALHSRVPWSKHSPPKEL